MKRAYTSAFTTTDPVDDLMKALFWAEEQAEGGQNVTLWCQHVDSLPEKGLADRLRRAGVRVVVEQRGSGTVPRDFQGPVVAVGFNTLDRLIEIEPFEHPLCLVGAWVPENFGGFAALDDHPHRRWIEAFSPECLAGPTIVTQEPLIEDPVVARALRSFTGVTYDGTTMYDSRDGGRVTHGLLLLHDGGHQVDPERLYSAALRAGWKGDQAVMLRDVAREVVRGVRKRPKERYASGTLERWRTDAQQSGS